MSNSPRWQRAAARGLVMTTLVVLSLGTACGVAKEAYDRDISGLRAQVAGLDEHKARLVGETQSLEARIQALSAEKGRVTEAMVAALQRVRELEEVAARRAAVFERLRASLQAMISAGTLRLVQKRGLLVVQMADAILFDTGRFEVKPAGREAIIQLSDILRALPDRRFQVSGHTDDRGTEDFNWRLSCDRALSVLAVMREAGMPPDRISVAGYAWFQPDADNATDEGRTLNRRIEFVLVPNLDELQLPE